MRYGVPYMGSKNKIARQIVDFLPAGNVLVDLFAGGCAISHAAALSGKWKRVIANDKSDIINLFFDAVAGKYKNEKRWISREDFFAKKDSDPYIKYCWSFGFGGYAYMYGKNIEEYKHLLHNVYTADDLTECKKAIRALLKYLNTFKTQSPERLQSLESLERLERLESLERLEKSNKDYQDVEIPDGAVVYCDIPYNNCSETITGRTYLTDFDFGRFYSWAQSRDFPVYISEYSMPSGFTEVWACRKVSSYSSTNNNKVTIEKIFIQDKFAHTVSLEKFSQPQLFDAV